MQKWFVWPNLYRHGQNRRVPVAMAIIIILNGKITVAGVQLPICSIYERAIGVIFNETAMPYLGYNQIKSSVSSFRFSYEPPFQ
jgi:hypothetical protein